MQKFTKKYSFHILELLRLIAMQWFYLFLTVRLGFYLQPVHTDFNHRDPKLANENRWRLYITKNSSSIEDSGSVTPCPGAPPRAASRCSAARTGRRRDRVQTQPHPQRPRGR